MTIKEKIESLIENKSAQATYTNILLECIFQDVKGKYGGVSLNIDDLIVDFVKIAIKWGGQYKLSLGGTAINDMINKAEEKFNIAKDIENYVVERLLKPSTVINKWAIPSITQYTDVFCNKGDSIYISKDAARICNENWAYFRRQNFLKIKSRLIGFNETKEDNVNQLFEANQYIQDGEVEEIEYESYGENEFAKTALDIIQIHNYMQNKGFDYELKSISNFYLSLKSKPFTILAGISGTGKSKLVRLFTEAIGADFTLIPVKPDWSDATELLGYKDLEGEYQVGKFIKVIREACKPENKSTPYIVCLDEMNLARVEYYFSDFLSLIESREEVDGEIVTDCFNSWGIEADYIPENVYIVGTVNMDETTFQFSKKVLDRANTIELSEVDLSFDFDMDYDDDMEPMLVHNDALKSEYLLLKDCKEYKELAQRTIDKLISINEILKSCDLEFAYRVRDEIIFYMVYNEQYQLLSEEEAFDFQVLQKILPRISGTSRQVEDLLIKLLDFCTEEGLKEKVISEERDELQIRENAIYKKSVNKLLQMLRRCEDGFTSFW